ncbi:MAG: 3-hydroxy-3-methylglutaryl-CoA reductase [Candidatus Peregrinibacteria bacterium]
MDLRTLPPDITPHQRCNERRNRIERALGIDLAFLTTEEGRIGHAEEKNCEQMFGTVPVPVGYAGTLSITLSNGEKTTVHLPLATTEGALVASVNRGCKVLSEVSGGALTKSIYHGMSRSLVLKPKSKNTQSYTMAKNVGQEHSCPTFGKAIDATFKQWKSIGEATSHHLKILNYEIDEADGYTFLTISCDTGEAMGMNMVTIAAQAIGTWLADELDAEFITVAGNVDSDKKPSQRTHDRGRGYEVTAEATIPASIIETILKTTPEKLLEVAKAKLEVGSKLAGAIGANLHVANIIAALYLATGQDPAHVVEGSMADTTVSGKMKNESGKFEGLSISVHLPAILVGIRGGGTTLPAQSQCLKLLLGTAEKLSAMRYPLCAPQRLAEIIAAAVLAGELSLLAAQATGTLAKAHKEMGR